MMARSGAFGKKGKFLGAGIAVLAVLSLLLYYGVASGTDFVRTDRLWSFESSAKILALGLSVAVIVYLGIDLLKNQLSLRRYTLLAWGWFVIFLLFAGLFAVVFPSSAGSGWSFCIWAFPKMVWASIFLAALGGFLRMAAGGKPRRRKAVPHAACFYRSGENMGGLPPLPLWECWQRVLAGSFISWETRRSFPARTWPSFRGLPTQGHFWTACFWPCQNGCLRAWLSFFSMEGCGFRRIWRETSCILPFCSWFFPLFNGCSIPCLFRMWSFPSGCPWLAG